MMNEENVAAGFSGISHITPEFIKSLETQLIIRKSLLEDSIKGNIRLFDTLFN